MIKIIDISNVKLTKEEIEKLSEEKLVLDRSGNNNHGILIGNAKIK